MEMSAFTTRDTIGRLCDGMYRNRACLQALPSFWFRADLNSRPKFDTVVQLARQLPNSDCPFFDSLCLSPTRQASPPNTLLLIAKASTPSSSSTPIWLLNSLP